MTKTRKPSLPAVRTSDLALKQVLDGLREQAMRWRGDVGPLEDRVVTIGDLVDGNIAKLRPGATGRSDGTVIESREGTTETRVGALSNLQASPVFEEVILSWDGTNQPNYSLTEIWRATVDDFGQAVFRGTAIPGLFADSATPGQTYYYWIRAVSTTGNPGPINDTDGTKAVTKNRPAYLLEELTGEITESQLYQDLSDRIDLIDGPESLPGSVNARVQTETQARQDADSALASDISTVQAKANDNESAIQTEQTARADADDALASDFSTVQAKADDNESAIQSEATTRASADDALASDINTVQATAQSKNVTFRQSSPPTANAVGDLWIDTSNGNKLYRWDGSNWVEADNQQIATNNAAIQKRSEVKVDGNQVSAQYDLRLQTTVDGQLVMGGFGLAADGSGVQAGFNVDQLWVGHPDVDYSQGGKRFPFIIDGGVTYIDEAMIREAAIGSAQIADLAAEKINAGTINVAVKLTAAEITGGSLNINSRFTVDSNGNVVIRSASSGARMEQQNDVIKVFDGNGTLRVQLGNLNA